MSTQGQDGERTPYERGFADGYARKPGPAFPTSSSSWAYRLYCRGWSAGISRRELYEAAPPTSNGGDANG